MTFTQAQLNAEINSQLPTNGTGAITASILRGVLIDMVSGTFQGTGLGITRAQISTTTITAPIFSVTGFYTAGDLGMGAVYTSIGATAGGLMAIQDLSGAWFNLLIRDGNINIGYLGVIGNGTTDDSTNFTSVRSIINRFGNGIPQTVTISIGNPAVITFAPTTAFDITRIRTNDAFVFATTGQLPTGIQAGTIYYVKSVGYANGSFQISTVNNYTCTAEGAAVITSGVQSGVHTARILSQTWINTIVPPASYRLDTFSNLCGGQARNKTYAYGSSLSVLGIGNAGTISVNPVNGLFSQWALIQTYNSSNVDSPIITLVSPADSSLFLPNHWILVVALDTQNALGAQTSWPPNDHYFEFAKIKSINSITGAITLFSPLKQTYKSTYPTWWAGTHTNGDPSGGGPATIYAMPGNWDAEHVYCGLHFSNTTGQSVNVGRSITYIDCEFDDDGPLPSTNKEWIARNSIWGSGAASQTGNNLEFDKLVEYAEMTDCTVDSLTNISSAMYQSIFERCNIGILAGTGRNTNIRDCSIGQLRIGVNTGACDSTRIENSTIGFLQIPSVTFISSYQAQQPFSYFTLVNQFTFSNGTLSIPMAADLGAHSWAVPGRKMFINDLEGLYQNMGYPFDILDVRTSGANLLIDTTLGVDPTTLGGSTNSIVTIDIANPAVVHWNLHGLVADTPIIFTTTGTLPTGILLSPWSLSSKNVYYVLAAGLLPNQFEFSLTKGGAPIITSGSQSGVQTCIANPLHYEPHPCPRLTVKDCTGSYRLTDLNGASDEPIFSRAKRTYVSQIGPQQGWPTNVDLLWGNLVSLSVNVVRPYTGGLGPINMTIVADGFDGGLIHSTLTFIINLKIAGLRIVTPAGVTGAQAGDTLAATGAWISNGLQVSTDNMFPALTATNPIVELEVLTDQGITRYQNMVMQAPTQTHPAIVVDTGMWGSVI